MNGIDRKALSIGLGSIAAALLMASGQAYAVSACNADESLSALLAMGSCEIADKIFSDFSFTTNLATHALFTINPVSGDVVVTFSRDGHNYLTGSNTFDYTVSVAPGSTKSIVEHTLGVDVSSTAPPLVSVTDQVMGNNSGSNTLVIKNDGSTKNPQSVVFSSPDTTETVMLTAMVASGAQLNSITNDIAERVFVPEPASLSLLGLGLFGLGFARRRRS